ncbi:MAG: hypothetical protein WA102_10805 [Candidatus Methanoperedens sp.]
MIFPEVSLAAKLQPNKSRLFIGAYGFEWRSLGWANYQLQQGVILNRACVFKYNRPKGKNRIHELQKILVELGIKKPKDIPYDAKYPYNIEEVVATEFNNLLTDFEEIIVDITSMTKLLILVCLCKLSVFSGTLRIVYSEAEDYAPTKKEYDEWKREMKLIANFPSRGSGPIIRTKCLSSIRMQGQPVSLIAFTSFNEQLVRYMLGTISPHRFLFINGKPPRKDYDWREKATQEIHNKLIDQYSDDNPIENGLLKRTANTLDYRDTIYKIDEIYKQFGTHERIICAATGSKMQTVGLFFSKMMHPDIHVEYPMPDSYFVKGISKGVRMVHEVVIPHFSEFIKNIVIEEGKMS